MNLLHGFLTWRRYRAASDQLHRKSDHELADLGITRSEIRQAVRNG